MSSGVSGSGGSFQAAAICLHVFILLACGPELDWEYMSFFNNCNEVSLSLLAAAARALASDPPVLGWATGWSFLVGLPRPAPGSCALQWDLNCRHVSAGMPDTGGSAPCVASAVGRVISASTKAGSHASAPAAFAASTTVLNVSIEPETCQHP